VRLTPPDRIVLDASAAVAMLTDSGPEGEWATALATGVRLAAPDLMPFEAGNILRRHVLAGLLDPTAATLAHGDLLALPVDLYPYAGLGDRAWPLRTNLTCYDASYVALAELLGVSLVTLDARLDRSAGPRCTVVAYRAAAADAVPAAQLLTSRPPNRAHAAAPKMARYTAADSRPGSTRS
jgi:predicted nucleic acid-binding protein